jgi:hypothetical protein
MRGFPESSSGMTSWVRCKKPARQKLPVFQGLPWCFVVVPSCGLPRITGDCGGSRHWGIPVPEGVPVPGAARFTFPQGRSKGAARLSAAYHRRGQAASDQAWRRRDKSRERRARTTLSLSSAPGGWCLNGTPSAFQPTLTRFRVLDPAALVLVRATRATTVNVPRSENVCRSVQRPGTRLLFAVPISFVWWWESVA